MAQILLPNLAPGRNYAVQVRAVNSTTVSDWSPLLTFTTVGDTLAPAPVTSLSWTVVGTAFAGTWVAPTTNSDSSPLTDFKDYQVTLVANSITVIYYVTEPRFDLSFEQNKNAFGTPQATVQISVKARDITGNLSTVVTTSVSNPAPAQPANLVITAVNEALGVKWDAIADTDLDHYEVNMSTSGGFTPSGANLIYSGLTTGTTIITASNYSTEFIKVCSVDVFGTKSTYASGSGTPTSSFVVDVTAPAQPTSLAITGVVDSKDPSGANIIATVTWLQTTVSDLAGFSIRYRKTGDTNWFTVDVNDGSLRAATIIGLSPGTGYDFQIKSFDFSGNTAGFTATSTMASVTDTTAPSAPSGVTAAAGLTAVIVSWTENTETDVKNGAGTYEVQIATNVGFSTGVQTNKTTATVASFTGLTGGTTYWARVRAIDSSGNPSTYTSSTPASVNATAPTASDGLAPASSPTPTVLAGISSLYVTWTPIANNDPVTYEVHLSTSTGFTPSGATKVMEVSGSLANIRYDATNTALVYGTTYFIKLIAKDRDGSAAAGSQGSGTIAKAASTDINTVTYQQVHDGSAPASSPTPTILSGLGYLFAYWTPTTNNDPVIYEVHVSTSTGFTPSGVTKVMEVTDSSCQIKTSDSSGTVLVYGTTYFVKLIAKDQDGSAAAGTQGSGTISKVATTDITSVSGNLVHDGSVPSSSPTPTLKSGIGYLVANWTAVANNDLVTYEVHVSTSTGFTPSGATKVLETTATSAVIRTSDSTGTLLVQGTTYFVKLIAKDADGSAAAGTQASAALVQAASTDIASISGTQVHDGSAPSSSPTPTLRSGIGYLFAFWTGVANNDPVTYEVHISTSTGFTPSGATKAFETSDTSATIKTDGSGVALVYGTTYFVKLIAKDLDGSAAAGTQASGTIAQVATGDISSISGTLVHDGSAPASSPTPTLKPGLGYLYASWSATANNDPVTYEVHVSTSSGFTPSGSTKVMETTALSCIIKTSDSTGTVLAYGTTYFVKLIAKDLDGAAAAGTQASSTISQVAAADITANTITAGQIAANTITASQIAATTITAAQIAANTITAGQIAANTITASQIAANTITAGQIAANTITAGQIAAGTITATQIAASTITGTNIAASTIVAGNIAAGAITATKLNVTAGGGNLFSNSSFEDTTGAANGWTAQTSATLAADATTFYNGLQSLKVTLPTNAGLPGVNRTISLLANTTYTLSAWVRLPSSGGPASGVQLSVSGTGVTTATSAFFTTTLVWTRIFLTFTTNGTGGNVTCAIQASNTTAAQIFNVDAVQLETGDVPTSWGPQTAELLPGTIVANMIAANTITASQIAAGTITSAQIAANTITAGNIAANTITASQIAAGTITGTQIAATTITASNIVSGTITTTQIAANTIVAGNIAAGTITGTQIAATTIAAGNIVAGTITTSQIAASTITGTNIAASTITGTNIAATTITAAKLSVTAGGGNMLSNSSFEDSTSAVNGWTAQTSATIAGDATTFYDSTHSCKVTLPTNAGLPGINRVVTLLASTTYTLTAWVKLPSAGGPASGVQLSASGTGVTTVTSSFFTTTNVWSRIALTFTTNGSGGSVTIAIQASNTTTAQFFNVDAVQLETGDVPTMWQPLVSELLPGTIVASMIAANTITASQIAAGTITTTQIAANTIVAGNIAANTITASQIAANTITAGQIAANTITASQIAAATITTSQIAANTITGSNIAATTITASNITSATITTTQIAAGTITASNINMANFYAASGTVTNTLTIGSSGAVQSSNYSAGAAGWQLAQNFLEINGGTIRAAALLLQQGDNIMPLQYADFEFNSAFYTSSVFVVANAPTLTIDSTGANVKYNSQALKIVSGIIIPTIDFTTGSTTYNIIVEGSTTYIVSMWVLQASGSTQNAAIRFKDSVTAVTTSPNQSVPNNTYTRIQTTFTTASTATGAYVGIQIPQNQTWWVDGIQIEKQWTTSTVASAWKPPSATSIDGGIIKTGSIQSTSLISTGQSSGTQPAWSVSLSGSATFASALVRGHLIVGDSSGTGLLTDQYISSANYLAGTSGYIIKGDGSLELNTGTFRGALIGGSIQIGGTSGFNADGINGIWLGNATFGSAPFRVTLAGAVTATSGVIGGWTLGSTTLTGTNVTLDSAGAISVGTGTSIVKMQQGVGLWSGATTIGSSTSIPVLNFPTFVSTGGVSNSGTFYGFTLTSVDSNGHETSPGRIQSGYFPGAVTTPDVSSTVISTNGGTNWTNATYFFVVTALGLGGESLKSTQMSAVLTTATSPAFTNLPMQGRARGYRIYYGTVSGTYTNYIELLGLGKNIFFWSDRTGPNTYNSNINIPTVTAAAGSPPVSNTSADSSAGTINLSWSAVSGASSYNVYRIDQLRMANTASTSLSVTTSSPTAPWSGATVSPPSSDSTIAPFSVTPSGAVTATTSSLFQGLIRTSDRGVHIEIGTPTRTGFVGSQDQIVFYSDDPWELIPCTMNLLASNSNFVGDRLVLDVKSPSFGSGFSSAQSEVRLYSGTRSSYADTTLQLIGGGGAGIGGTIDMTVTDKINLGAAATKVYLGGTADAAHDIAGAWVAYTPIWNGATTNPVLGNGTIEAYYKIVGKTCFVRMHLVMGSTTTFGSGNWSFSLPFNRNTTPNQGQLGGYARDASAANGFDICRIGFSGSATVTLNNGNPPGSTRGTGNGTWDAATPFAWAVSDIIDVQFCYETT